MNKKLGKGAADSQCGSIPKKGRERAAIFCSAALSEHGAALFGQNAKRTMPGASHVGKVHVQHRNRH